MSNPFTPRFGVKPVYFARSAVRDEIINDIIDSLLENPNNPARMSVITGMESIGKTTLLSLITEKVNEAGGWIVVHTNCMQGMMEDIFQQALHCAAEYLPKNGNIKLTGITIAQLLGLEWENDSKFDYSPNWRTNLTKILDFLSEKEKGLLIVIDETVKSEEIERLLSTFALLAGENKKIALILAGRNDDILKLFGDGRLSFANRAPVYTLERIPDDEIKKAIIQTVENSGKKISDDAVQKAVSAIGGFPYMLQLVGFYMWKSAEKEETITIRDVESALVFSKPKFEKSVYRVIVSSLSEIELNILFSMVLDGGKSKLAKLREESKISPYIFMPCIEKLIDKCVIEKIGNGSVSFAIPGFETYLKEKMMN